jgi:hypothetical protein
MSAVVIVGTFGSGQLGSGAIDVAGAVAPAPTNNLGTNCKAPSSSNLHRMMGHKDWFLQKMAAAKVKAILEQDVLLETSAHCIRWLAGSLFQDLRR